MLEMTSRNVAISIVLIASLAIVADAFQIVEIEYNPSKVKKGDSMTLKCTTSSWFEFCIWRHNDRVCEFEWKRSHWAVKKQTCTALHRRVEFVGNYETHECEIQLNDITDADSGVWTCELEAYTMGPARGSTDKANITVHILSDHEASNLEDSNSTSSDVEATTNSDSTNNIIATTEFTFNAEDDTQDGKQEKKTDEVEKITEATIDEPKGDFVEETITENIENSTVEVTTRDPQFEVTVPDREDFTSDTVEETTRDPQFGITVIAFEGEDVPTDTETNTDDLDAKENVKFVDRPIPAQNEISEEAQAETESTNPDGQTLASTDVSLVGIVVAVICLVILGVAIGVVLIAKKKRKAYHVEETNSENEKQNQKELEISKFLNEDATQISFQGNNVAVYTIKEENIKTNLIR